jgi:hypothetical protein
MSQIPTLEVAMRAKAEFDSLMQKLHPALSDAINKQLIEKVAVLGVESVLIQSLNLVWVTPNGKRVNFGCIQCDGLIYTCDVYNKSMSHDESVWAHNYVIDLAHRWGMDVDGVRRGNYWGVQNNGKQPRADEVMEMFDDWVAAIAQAISNYPHP